MRGPLRLVRGTAAQSGFTIVKAEQWANVARQLVEQCFFSQQQARRRILQEEGEPLPGLIGSQGHIGPACLHNGKQADDEGGTALQAESDGSARGDAAGAEVMGELVGSA